MKNVNKHVIVTIEVDNINSLNTHIEQLLMADYDCTVYSVIRMKKNKEMIRYYLVRPAFRDDDDSIITHGEPEGNLVSKYKRNKSSVSK